jgi:hypothetical protein
MSPTIGEGQKVKRIESPSKILNKNAEKGRSGPKKREEKSTD